MAKQTTHSDAERLKRIEQGLPPDVHAADTEAAYEALGKQPKTKPKTASPKPTKKGGSSG